MILFSGKMFIFEAYVEALDCSNNFQLSAIIVHATSGYVLYLNVLSMYLSVQLFGFRYFSFTCLIMYIDFVGEQFLLRNELK